MSKEKIGSSKISYHNSGQINRDNQAPNSGLYENTGGRKDWTFNGQKLQKDNNGVWKDPKGNVYRGGN